MDHPLGSKVHYLIWFVKLLLEDVAENPARLARAMELAERAINEAYAKGKGRNRN